MTRGSFNYCVSISSFNTDVLVPGTNTSYIFASLLSGTPYNLTVRTVGALGFESEEVQIFMVNTSKSFIPLRQKKNVLDLDFYHTPVFSRTTRTFQCEKSEGFFGGNESDYTDVDSS